MWEERSEVVGQPAELGGQEGGELWERRECEGRIGEERVGEADSVGALDKHDAARGGEEDGIVDRGY